MKEFEVPENALMVESRSDLDIEEFRKEYGKSGRPLLLKGAMKNWVACERWTLEFFKSKYGNHTVIVKRSLQREELYEVNLGEYIDYLQEPAKEEDPLYLADWDFSYKYPELLKDYQVPRIFKSWLRFVPRAVMPPFRWFYIGPAQSGTRMHVDVAMTSAWNAVFVGRKRWVFFSPDQREYLYEGAVNAFQPDYEKYPLFKKAKPIYAIQEPGFIIFTPSGWWHQVINEEDCVSITENFIDVTNYKKALFPYISVVLQYQTSMIRYLFRKIRNKKDNESFGMDL